MFSFQSVTRRRWASKLLLVVGLPALLSCSSCDDDDDDPQPVVVNTVTLELQHNAPGNTVPLRLNTTYSTVAGQDYRVVTLLYYVSNVKLIRADGTVWAEPNSYHLVKVEGAPADNPAVSVINVPGGDYTSVEFSIGVDSVRNHTGDQSGALSPNEGMLWNWSTGYKFWVMEGDYVSAHGTEPLTYHLGTDALYRTIRLTLPTAATVRSNIAPDVHMDVDINHFFDGLDLTDAQQRFVMNGSPAAPGLANKLPVLFEVEHVHNEAH